ncbi:MAG: sulfite exporter TauE/SafE family protein [Dehalococcoidia bacterium]|nr:sulfite exporter TauE/SafE family protein [Dehalococcoidia bacterium]
MEVSSLVSSNAPLLAAIGLGLLCAISPCVMATNVAALAYVGRKSAQPGHALMTAALYTLGRMFSYTAIGVLVVLVGLEVSVLSRVLQGAGARFIGPFLILIGVILLVAHRLPVLSGGGALQRLGARFGDMGVLGGFPLGAVCALAFCPYSGVLFFAVLMPLALRTSGGVALPVMFAVGTGVPVLIFGALLSFGVARVSAWADRVTRADRAIRVVTALVFVGTGVYYLVTV